MNVSLFHTRIDPATRMKSTMETSIERTVEVRSNRSRKQKIERRAFADSCTATWPWAIGTRRCAIWWNHFLVSTFRACVTVRRVEASAWSHQGARGTFSRIPNRTTKTRGDALQRRWTGDRMHGDVCAMVKTTRALPSGLSFIAINTSERVHRVLNDSRLSSLLFSLSRTYLFSFRLTGERYVHSNNVDYCDVREHGTWSCWRRSAANPAGDFEAAE